VNPLIKDLQEKERINGQRFLLANVSKGVTNTGAPYLNVTLQDSSGQIEGRKWEVTIEDDEVFNAGNIVSIVADVIQYRNILQLKIINGSVIPSTQVDLTEFIASAPIPREVLQKKLMDYIARIETPDIKSIVETLVRENLISFAIYPAASHNHHEYASGLIHHTVGMLDAAAALLNVYPSLHRDYLFAGVILHDMGKLVELSGPILPKYTTKGKLLGHISIMQAKIQQVADKLKIESEAGTILQHLVLSHHGANEFGSPVLPMTREAEVLSYLDNLDARINMIDKALSSINQGEFTPRVMSLENRSFYKIKSNK
jgi:3'-5' exoribonuclease